MMDAEVGLMWNYESEWTAFKIVRGKETGFPKRLKKEQSPGDLLILVH